MVALLIACFLHHSLLFHPRYLTFLDEMESITLNRFVFNMGKGYHSQCVCHSTLFHDYKQFYIKALAAHHLVIQKKVSGLLVKGGIKPFTADAEFYS